MTKREATASPWRVQLDSSGEWLVVHNNDAEVVCIMKSHQKADGRLIVAAPEMRDALLHWFATLQAEADDMTCDAGNFDGGSPETCGHCATRKLQGEIEQLLQKAGVFSAPWLIRSLNIRSVVNAMDQWEAWDTLRDRPVSHFGLLVTAEPNESGEPIAVRTEILMRRWHREKDAEIFYELARQQGLVQ